MKAASSVAKTYVVKVAGTPSAEGLAKIRRGLTISTDRGERVKTAPAKVRSVRESDNPWFEVTLKEGRNRQIRRMFEEIGYHVEKIKRVKYDPLSLDLPPVEFRLITMEETSKLQAAPS